MVSRNYLRFLRFGGAGFIVALLLACEDPSRVAREDAAIFRREYPNNFYRTDRGDGPVFAVWAGDASLRPLLLIHGSPGSWEGWAAFLRNPELTKDFHIIVVDRPGYGGSEAGQTERSLIGQARRIVQVLDQNRSGLGAIVVGHSLGGPVALRMAVDFPGRIAGLGLISSAVDPSLERTKWFQVPGNWSLLSWILPTPLRVCNEEILALKEELVTLEPEWSTLRLPVAIVHGQDDDLVPVANVDFMRSHLDADSIVSLDLISEMNHFVPWRRPDAIIDAIKRVKEIL